MFKLAGPPASGGAGGVVWETFGVTADTAAQLNLFTLAGSNNAVNRKVKVLITNNAWVNFGIVSSTAWGAGTQLWLVIDSGCVVTSIGGQGGGGALGINGFPGSVPVQITWPITISNSGIIAAPGGGGGQGAYYDMSGYPTTNNLTMAAGGGGGGGRGGRAASSYGSGGDGGFASGAPSGGAPGLNGYASDAWGEGGGASGGSSGFYGDHGGTGGAGGGWGQPGLAGLSDGNLYIQFSPGAGGAACDAVTLSGAGTVTWTPRGTIYGVAPP